MHMHERDVRGGARRAVTARERHFLEEKAAAAEERRTDGPAWRSRRAAPRRLRAGRGRPLGGDRPAAAPAPHRSSLDPTRPDRPRRRPPAPGGASRPSPRPEPQPEV